MHVNETMSYVIVDYIIKCNANAHHVDAHLTLNARWITHMSGTEQPRQRGMEPPEPEDVPRIDRFLPRGVCEIQVLGASR